MKAAEAVPGELRLHAPFDRMEGGALAWLAPRLRLAYFAPGQEVLGPTGGIARLLYVVQSGLARGELDPSAGPPDVVEYGRGECFPLAAVTGARAPRHRYVAAGDLFCWEMDAADVVTLGERSAVFRGFCANRLGVLLQQAYRQLQSASAAPEQSGVVLLAGIARRDPVCCKPGDSALAALQAMQRGKVGSIVVVDADRRPQGIFTERDLLRHVVSGAFDAALPVSRYMSAPVRTLPATASAADAAALMASGGFRHVVVEEAGRLAGVVSERDLFALQRTSMRDVIHSIEVAPGVDALALAAADIRRLALNLVAQGVGAEQLAGLVASLNDRLGCRLIGLRSSAHGLDPASFCWVALGSEGRLEQTLATDQDNAIIFRSGGQAGARDALRARLLAFAREVNADLDACGFPLCRGGIMASNPEWCMDEAEWRERFASWIRNPLPQAVLNATIFFDLRGLWGEAALADGLRQWLALEVKDNQRFLRAMAAGALESRPPLGLIADFVTSDGDGAPHSIDLKAQGTRAFVDAARILALAAGVAETNTAKRLRLAGAALRMPEAETDAMVEALHYILSLRLRRQGELAGGAGVAGSPNRIDPDSLNELERRVLKESFRQARRLQSRIAMDFGL